MSQRRFWEILPGLTAWLVIIFPLWGSFVVPELVAYFTIGFLIYWLYQSFKSAILGIVGYFKIRKAEQTNWREKYNQEKKPDWLEWEKIKHVIIIPNANESAQKLANPLDSLLNQKDISPKQLVVVLAMEARIKQAVQKAITLQKKYKGKFGKLICTFHPPNLPGEVKGKASNEAWAAKVTKRLLVDQLGWDIKLLTVTSCDADARFHPKYFSALTYWFASSARRYLLFWQAPILWHNNLNRVPFPVRLIGVLGNIIHIADLQEPERLFFNYSTYSLSFQLLHETGYWDPDIIPEDWHLFLQAFFTHEGQTEVWPIFLPVSIDAPEGATFWEALKNRYRQCQRHAWGATDLAYGAIQAQKHPEIPLGLRIARVFKIFQTHLLWSTNWFILTLGASLPALLNPKFTQTALGYNLPRFARTVLTTCLLALFVIITLDYKLRPKQTQPANFKEKLVEWVSWLSMPIATLFMAVLPGLDAHTRLMLGKRLEYKTTKKY